MAVRFGRNLWRKLVALVVAVGLWFLFGGQRPLEQTLRVPIEYVNLAQGLDLRGDLPAVADVRVSAPRAVLARLAGVPSAVDDLARLPAGHRPVPLSEAPARTTDQLRAIVDVAAAQPGLAMFPVRVLAPEGVSVVRVDPPEVAVHVR